ncbi:MAG: alpha/beta hydrolase [Vitreoscilla sp.]|jgi:phospholipase/carboxylesterase
MRLDTLQYQTGDAPKSCIIVLHGLGASATDFVPVARQWNLRALGDVRFVFPFAPEQPVTINGGMRMPAWYDILGLDLVRREDEKSLRESAAALQALIDREIAGGIPASRIVLAGFSQGCAMTLLAGLRAPQRLAGLLGMSGYLPLAATTAAERSEANRDVPIFLGHGRMDPVVPFQRGADARDALVALGHAVEWHDYPMQHSVCEEEIEDAQAWLLKVLA